MACLAITGAVSSSPGAALNCILDLPPLDVHIMAVARRGAYHLQCGGLWQVRSCGHTKITSAITGDGILDMITDHMQTRYSFSQSFKSIITSREEWHESMGASLLADNVWYTDGSKTCEGTGAGIHGTGCMQDFSIPMGKYPTVFQAEVTAILECCRVNLMLSVEGKSIRIFSDSQAAIRALTTREFSSRLVWECYKAISLLGRCNEVSLVWVPGHSGIRGNEAADVLANVASRSTLVGPEPFCGISRCVANQSILVWARREHTSRWRAVTGHRVSKLVLKAPSSCLARDLLRMTRKDLKQVVELITGHGHWLKHLERMGIYEDEPICRKCGKQEETADHLLFDCEALCRARYTVFGLVTKDGGLPYDDLAGRILRYCRYMDLPAV